MQLLYSPLMLRWYDVCEHGACTLINLFLIKLTLTEGQDRIPEQEDHLVSVGQIC